MVIIIPKYDRYNVKHSRHKVLSDEQTKMRGLKIRSSAPRGFSQRSYYSDKGRDSVWCNSAALLSVGS